MGIKRKFYELNIYEGSIIRFGSKVGHIRNIDNGVAFIDSYYEDKDPTKLIIGDLEVSEGTKGLQRVTQLRETFMDDLFDLGYSINIFNDLFKLPSLRPGAWVKAPNNQNHSSCGVILKMNKRNLVIGFLDSRCGLKEEKYKIDEGIGIRLLTLKEKQKSLNTLETFGYTWDEAAMWVSSLKRPRMRIGQTYWYITDRFTLSAEKDKYTPLHNQRHECGNYFLTPDDAEEVLNVIREKIDAKR